MHTIQQAMFHEVREKTIFDKAHAFAHDYLGSVFERNVYPSPDALRGLAQFDEAMPEAPGNAPEILEVLHRNGSPATVAQLGGRYFGFVCGSAVPAGLAAKQLATFWDQNSAMYVLSPLASKLESVVERWLRQLLNLPGETVAGFVSGTSAANLCGLAAARYRVLRRAGWDVNGQGVFGAPKIRVVAGRRAHSTVVKALALLGFGNNNVEWVDADEQGRIIPARLPALDEKTIVILQAGNVDSGSFDAFREICGKAARAHAWVHIDGAFGLWAAAVEGLRHLTDGIGLADSWALDGHKTLNTPYDNGIVLCKDKEALVSALHMASSYIIVSTQERDGMFFTPEMSRRARIIELWATLKYLGREGIDQMVSGMHQRAVQFADEVGAIPGFTVVNDVVFNQVLVRCDTDDLTARTIEKIQELRECWVGGSTWIGKKVIRVSVCSWATTPDDIVRSVKSFGRALEMTTKMTATT